MSFIDSLISENGKVTLQKYDGSDLRPGTSPGKSQFTSQDNLLIVTFLDVETTGKNRDEDKIIELALKTVDIDKTSGFVISVLNEYGSLEDPGIPISPEATAVNGITDEMVRDKSIDWSNVEQIFSSTELIVAHNSAFDRRFIDRYSNVSHDKVWGCTMVDIDWLKNGFPSKGLEILSMWHGFYYDSHRGMNDVAAMIHLVTHDFESGRSYSSELLENSFKHYYLLEAQFKYDVSKVEKCKAEGFFWNNPSKTWCKKISNEEIDSTREWVSANLQDGYFTGTIVEVPLYDRFKKG